MKRVGLLKRLWHNTFPLDHGKKLFRLELELIMSDKSSLGDWADNLKRERLLRRMEDDVKYNGLAIDVACDYLKIYPGVSISEKGYLHSAGSVMHNVQYATLAIKENRWGLIRLGNILNKHLDSSPEKNPPSIEIRYDHPSKQVHHIETDGVNIYIKEIKDAYEKRKMLDKRRKIEGSAEHFKSVAQRNRELQELAGLRS